MGILGEMIVCSLEKSVDKNCLWLLDWEGEENAIYLRFYLRTVQSSSPSGTKIHIIKDKAPLSICCSLFEKQETNRTQRPSWWRSMGSGLKEDKTYSVRTRMDYFFVSFSSKFPLEEQDRHSYVSSSTLWLIRKSLIPTSTGESGEVTRIFTLANSSWTHTLWQALL